MRAVLLKAYHKNLVNKVSILSKASGKDKMILELGKKNNGYIMEICSI